MSTLTNKEIKGVMSISACLAMLRKHLQDLATSTPPNLNINHINILPTYSATIQYTTPADTTSPLSKEEKKFIQQVVRTLLYHGRAVNATILVALSSLASSQATPTKDTMQQICHLLNYVATHPNAILTYAKSNMILGIHSNASYLSKPKVHSHAGGHFSLSNGTNKVSTMVLSWIPPK